MTAYYISGTVFGVWALIIAGLGFTRKDFPGKSAVPIIAVSGLLFVATLGSVIVGGINEAGEEHGGEPAAHTK